MEHTRKYSKYSSQNKSTRNTLTESAYECLQFLTLFSRLFIFRSCIFSLHPPALGMVTETRECERGIKVRMRYSNISC